METEIQATDEESNSKNSQGNNLHVVCFNCGQIATAEGSNSENS